MGYSVPRAAVLRQALQKQQPHAPPEAQLLTVDEVTERLRLSRDSLYRYIRRNELKSIKFGKRRLFRESDLQAFIEQHQAEAGV
jgi:excisionase family DNA binding protein